MRIRELERSLNDSREIAERFKKDKIAYLENALLERLPQLAFNKNGNAMFGFGEDGYFKLNGTIVQAFLEMRARSEIVRSA